ncbi:MAG: hypothetical protein PWQ35_153 [Patescibacteria group bacterium]|nr:hypothetical protein [Patescibacteria group bacterium]
MSILKNKKLIFISLSVLLLLAIFLIFYFSWSTNYHSKLLPKTYIGNLNVSGLNINEVKVLLENEERYIREKGIIFSYNNESKTFPLSAVSTSPDIPENLLYVDSFVFDIETTINNAFSKKNRSFINYIKTYLIKNYINQTFLSFYYQDEIVLDWLDKNFPSLNIPAENAYFSLNEEGELINNKEKIGKTVALENLKNDLEEALKNLKQAQIEIKTQSQYPNILQTDLEVLRPQAEEILAKGDFIIFYFDESKKGKEKLTFSVAPTELITWITTKNIKQTPTFSFDLEKIKKYLSSEIAKQVDQTIILPRFEVTANKVSSWQVGKDGRELDLELSAENILNSLTTNTWEAEIKTKVIRVEDFTSENDFSIKELIGVGHSNFAGSSANRRHNIKVGADAVHGMLIKPGEEFSLVNTLGEIDANSGYLPELVIKGDKTIPEYGGGLCQVATTLFRSALSSGLPITARRNHSYRVSYYEPAGMDAAVYDPWPDVRFVNDTNNYILIQSRIEGDDIYFDFWGTKDGREATTTTPVIYNIVKPPATKIIETNDLEPGQKHCTESAHNGADAYFDYIVIYPEGATTTPRQEVRFNSHYVPWQEVCLVGKEEEKVEETEIIEEELIEEELIEE